MVLLVLFRWRGGYRLEGLLNRSFGIGLMKTFKEICIYTADMEIRIIFERDRDEKEGFKPEDKMESTLKERTRDLEIKNII